MIWDKRRVSKLLPMNFNLRQRLLKIVASAQALVPVTKSELVVVSVLTSGLSLGVILQECSSDARNPALRSEILHVADSLAALEATTLTGVNLNAEPVERLAAGDTLASAQRTFFRRPAAPSKIKSGTISLNTASLQDLMRLPGVGETTAQKIIEERERRAFVRIEDILRVRGIGKKKFEAMKPFLAL